MSPDREDPRLTVSRHAAELFLKHGVAATSGDDIAAAAGLSKRTVWRYFRAKESAVEPLFAVSSLRFASQLGAWPLDLSIENYLHAVVRPQDQTPREIADDILAVRLVALLPQEPALRSAWLMSCHAAEDIIVNMVARRTSRPATDFDVRLCGAAVMTALRIVDEDIASAAITDRRAFTLPEVIDRMAQAIRTASTLPICDPVLDRA